MHGRELEEKTGEFFLNISSHHIVSTLSSCPTISPSHLSTVNTLLRMNPETASLPDLNDSLPLHLAVFFNSSLEVVQAVYNVYPSAALVKDNTGRLPMHYCTLPEVKKLLLSASAPLARAGITDSFSRFST